MEAVKLDIDKISSSGWNIKIIKKRDDDHKYNPLYKLVFR